MKLIRTEDAVGHVLCHDLTQIIKDQYKDARFRKGHVVAPEDIPVLLGMGKEHLYVWEMTPGMLHEDEGAERLLALCANENMERSGVKEGKIELKASCDGLFLVRSESLRAVNAIDELMIATRKGGTAVKKGDKLAGMRVIPLIIAEEKLTAAKAAAGDTPLLELRPWVRKNRRHRGHRQRGEEGIDPGHLHSSGEGQIERLWHRDHLRLLFRRWGGERGRRHLPSPADWGGSHPLHRGYERGPRR